MVVQIPHAGREDHTLQIEYVCTYRLSLVLDSGHDIYDASTNVELWGDERSKDW